MQFLETPLAGAVLIKSESHSDERGSFYRSFCQQEFMAHGLPGVFVQCNISRNRLRGTLRGMHFQNAPKPEGKLVRCVRGAAYDVIIDLRPKSSTFCQWYGAELTESNADALYVPPGFAHGFITMADDTDILYQMTEFYAPELANGVRWNDPAFGIKWPLPVTTISDKDSGFQSFV